ncbi:radical SAM protein [Desulfuromonas sp. TF]|uniref:radical SAM protein n=1 Tax=Desulfuromonas sp. TF TaxID=1232410 RepID=UPI00040BF7F2|nr:radical SAM protein [Desulfuromonas sp. TF]
MAGSLSEDRRQRLIAANRDEYDESYSLLKFADPEALRQAASRREELLDSLSGRVEIGCRGSKLDMRRLSPGCRLCAEGAWSCLFINGRCNARCFYCPTEQEDTGLPTTNTFTFRTPADYVAYLERFGFRGASFSGGEPLLTPERTIDFLTAVKRRFGADLHTWLYTNGTRVDREILLRLRDAGLDEIRFDIGAVGYSLTSASLAVGIIPTVTIEIPAVPEEAERLKGLIAEMADSGIDHLNLHQMRLTPYNLPRLTGRPYTFLHGEKVTVLESELTALELLRHGLDRGIDLPVNYCSFVYKNRFQRSAARRRGGGVMMKGYEDLTTAGSIRALALAGDSADLVRQADIFRSAGAAGESWALSSARDRLFFRAALWPLIDFSPFRLLVGYGEAMMRESVSYRNAFTEVKLSTGRKVVVERWRTMVEKEMTGEEIGLFAERYLQGEGETREAEESGPWADIHCCEFIAAGLQEYF